MAYVQKTRLIQRPYRNPRSGVGNVGMGDTLVQTIGKVIGPLFRNSGQARGNPRTESAGFDGWWDDVKDFGSNVASGFSSAEQAQGAQAAMQQQAQNTALIAQAQSGGLGGIGIGTIAVVGGIGALAYFLLKK